MNDTATTAVRDLIGTFTKVALPKLARARRPKDLKALARDPKLIEALGRDLIPLIDAASRYTLPVKSRVVGHVSATITGAAGPLAANAAEGLLLAGPETVAITAPTALAVQVTAAVWETYVEFSTIVHKLRAAGIDDADSVQLAIMRMVLPEADEVSTAMVTRAAERLAARMLREAAAGWLPVAGPFVGSIASNFDLHRAHRAADSVIRQRKAPPRRRSSPELTGGGMLGGRRRANRGR
ncbi:MAG TPA: hypothetical protein VHD87_17190 [Acidimicrobiales bacterium]|nr:hypothetical protein [Acidimicrobiales bacterium]